VGAEAKEVDVSLLDWAVENVKVWTNCSVLTTSGHGPDFCHPGAVPRGAEFVTRQQWLSAKERKNMVEWNGEGLPPVGCECELYDLEQWIEVKIKYIGDHVVVVHAFGSAVHERVFHLAKHPDKFRPIRPKAERHREEVGRALFDAINWNQCDEPVSDSRMEDYRKAYDAIAAGKIPGVKLEDV